MIWHSFRNKLLVLFLLVAFVPIALLGYWSILSSRTALQHQVEYDLNALLDERVNAIEGFYHEKNKLLNTMADMGEVQNAMALLNTSFSSRHDSESEYTNHLKTVTGRLQTLMHLGEFADLYLISPDGNIVFSALQREDYATNLGTGPYRDTHLASLFSRTINLFDLGISERRPYAPAGNSLVEFIAVPIFRHMRFNGVLVVQLDSRLNSQKLSNYNGLGNSGEVVFAEYDGEHAVVISPLRHKTKDSGIYRIEIGDEKSMPIQLAVRGDHSSGLSTDYRGVETIAAWRYIPSLNWGLVAKIDTNEAFALAIQQETKIVIFIAVSLAFSLLAGTFFSRRVSRPLINMSNAALALSQGNLEQRLEISSNDELGKVAKSYNIMTSGLTAMVEQVDRISHGNFKEDVSPRSEQDRLGLAMQRLTQSLRQTANLASQVAQGNLETNIEIKGPDDRLGKALSDMMDNLKLRHWQQKGRQSISEVLTQQNDLAGLCDRIISELCQFFEAPAGAIYVTGEKSQLKLLGNFGLNANAIENQQFELGNGLVGQAAANRKPVLIDNLPPDYLTIESGLGKTQPKCLLIYPIVQAGKVRAVLEFGKLDNFDSDAIEMLDILRQPIGIALGAAQASLEKQALFEETLQQSEALKLSEKNLNEQQQALQASNEELTQQTEELRQSQDRMQQQREELRVTNEELEEQKNAISLQNTALKEAREKAELKTAEVERASQFKSEFLANMSHELRTPLNSLLILAKSFAVNEDGNLNADQIEAGEIIHGSATDLLDLINGILDLSKIEAGKMEVACLAVNPKEFSENMYRQFKHVAVSKHLEFSVECEFTDNTVIYSDQVKLEQIAKNLLSNAFKFTSQGSVILHVYSPTEENTDHDLVAFSVTDTGIGIPEDKQSLIFNAFQQADGSTSRKFGGTGLGLSICTEMARLLGGEIKVTSSEEQGSCFTLEFPSMDKDNVKQSGKDLKLPRKSSLKLVGSNQSENAVPKDLTEQSDKKESMLVIEDNPENSDVVVEMVQNKGFKCLTARTGTDGLALARKYQPTGILLDATLPDMGSKDIIEHLKSDTKTSHIPIHLMSFSGHSGTLSDTIGVINGPLTREKLDQAIFNIKTKNLGGLKELLIVEDDPSSQRVIEKALGRDNVNVTVVRTGKEALQNLSTRSYDGAIIDLGLPDMDGIELLEQVSSNQKTKPIPVIIYSARDLSEQDYENLRIYTNSIVIKGEFSDDRLRDEASLFLHSVRKKIEEKKPESFVAEKDFKDGELSEKTVLLVDDDMRNIYALSRTLKNQGMNVLTARDGKLALEQLAKHGDSVDLVLMDIMMPEMDGHEATRKIRAQEAFKATPIIALTAHAMAEDREMCLRSGASDYLAKPLDIDRLLAMMKMWL